MCRLGMFNKKFMLEKGANYMLKFLDQLEKSCGGHGNGIIFVDKGEITVNFKALGLGNEIIIGALFNKPEEMPDWFLYHTRVASKGSIKDENCHPYINDDESFGLMMNGTISSFGAFGKYLGDITDTEVLFKVIDKFNVDLEVLTELDPRFIGFKNGKVFASNSSGYSSLKFIEENGMIAIASESPTGEFWTSVKSEYLWVEGEKIEKEVYKARDYYSSYTSYYGSQKIYGNLNGKNGYWQGGKFHPLEESCEACTVDEASDEYEEAEMKLEEAKTLVKELIEENKNASHKELQEILDENFGLYPEFEGEYYTILVLDSKDVVFEDMKGNLIAI